MIFIWTLVFLCFGHLYGSASSEIKPYLIPSDHPLKSTLDALFSQSRVTENLETLQAAGFRILHVKESSFMIVASHPSLPGYLLKLYVDSDTRTRYGKPSWKWLKDRCKGAERIRKMIAKKKDKTLHSAR